MVCDHCMQPPGMGPCRAGVRNLCYLFDPANPDSVHWRAAWGDVGVLPASREAVVAFEAASAGAAGRVRAGLLSPVLYLGGAETWQVAVSRYVDPRRVCWVGAAIASAEPEDAHPAAVGRLRERMAVAQGRGAAAALAARVDVLVEWAVQDVGLLCPPYGDPHRPRVVAVSHGPGASPWAMATYRTVRGEDRFVAVSPSALEPVPAEARADAVVILNGVDPVRLVTTRTREAVRASWGVAANAPVAGYLGRLSTEKGPVAMAALAASLRTWECVVVGEGPEGAVLGSIATSQGLHNLHVVGGDDRAGDVLAAFDVLVVPSHYESFGLTVAEGWWCGVPVVATAAGEAGRYPDLCVPVSVGAGGVEMADAVRAATGDRAMVERARAHARSAYDPDRFGREWTDLIVGEGRRVSRGLLPAVAACPDRGGVLPASSQTVGCGCPELTECRAGAGPAERPTAVTLRECLQCVDNGGKSG